MGNPELKSKLKNIGEVIKSNLKGIAKGNQKSKVLKQVTKTEEIKQCS